jgi:uncharacterized protein Usg
LIWHGFCGTPDCQDALEVTPSHSGNQEQHDLHPHFPELKKFLDFWTRELDGLLHSVTVAHTRLIKPAEFKAVGTEFRLN